MRRALGCYGLVLAVSCDAASPGIERPEMIRFPADAVPRIGAAMEVAATEATPGDEGAIDGGGGAPKGLDAAPADLGEAVVDAETTPSETTASECPSGVVCVASLPFTQAGDTSLGLGSAFDAYACKLSADESGPEEVYRVDVPTAGLLSAAVYDGPGVDVDVHLLGAYDPDTCLDRGDRHARADVLPGTYWVVVDTWVDEGGAPFPGAYTLELGLYAPSTGPCELATGVMKRVGDDGNHLAMPATGPIVLEAHLVTQEEPQPYPATSTDELEAHYALSQTATGLVMARSQAWAPLEGGSFYGAGIGSPTLVPVVDEGWYVNMYWTKESRPARGTRMILRVPGAARAVVVSAGHETGPGNLAHIGGTPEETHFYLGTGHLSVLTLGIAVDQALPLGPRACTDEAP